MRFATDPARRFMDGRTIVLILSDGYNRTGPKRSPPHGRDCAGSDPLGDRRAGRPDGAAMTLSRSDLARLEAWMQVVKDKAIPLPWRPWCARSTRPPPNLAARPCSTARGTCWPAGSAEAARAERWVALLARRSPEARGSVHRLGDPGQGRQPRPARGRFGAVGTRLLRGKSAHVRHLGPEIAPAGTGSRGSTGSRQRTRGARFGAITPEEFALSILAQITRQRRAGPTDPDVAATVIAARPARRMGPASKLLIKIRRAALAGANVQPDRDPDVETGQMERYRFAEPARNRRQRS